MAAESLPEGSLSKYYRIYPELNQALVGAITQPEILTTAFDSLGGAPNSDDTGSL